MKKQRIKLKCPPKGQTMMASLEIINGLNEGELIALNEMIISRLKELHREKCVRQAQSFKIGDLVCFEAEGKKREGVVMRIHQKTIKVYTTESLSWNVSPRLLSQIAKPSQNLRETAEELFPKIFFERRAK